LEYVDLEPAQLIGTPVGARMTFILKRGSFQGPQLRGEFIPGAATG